MSKLFWFCYIITALVFALFVIFFFIGLEDGSISERNLGIWLLILLPGTALVVGTYQLEKYGYHKLSLALLSVPTFLGLMGLLYMIVIIISGSKTNWR